MPPPDDDFGDLYPDLPISPLSSLHGLGSLSRLYLDDLDDLSHPSCAARLQILATSEGPQLADGGMTEDGSCPLGNGGGSEKDDVDTDSEDDLHIVLDPVEQMVTGPADEGAVEDSDDGEDFIILDGGQTKNQEWWDGRVSPEDKDPNVERTNQSEKVQGSRTNTGVPQRAYYPGQVYRRNFQYVRTSAHGRRTGTISCPAAFCSRSLSLKCGNPRVDWTGNSNGLTLPHRKRFSTWCNNTHRSHLYGSEYSLPSNKTIFDIDIECMEEKPWRHPNADLSDYFNYGFEETSWKDYCRKLTKIRMVKKHDNKIKVDESSTLIQAVNQNPACDLTTASCQGTSDHMDKYPIIHAIQVGGGATERHSSVDIRERSTRESDAIFLIDVTSLNEESVSDDNCLEEQGISKMANDMSPRSQLDFCRGVRESRKSLLTVASESQDCFVKHKISGPATPPERIPVHGKRYANRGSSHSSSSHNDGVHALLETHIDGTQQSVAKEAKNMQSDTSADGHKASNCRTNKCTVKIDGNKGVFAGVLLRKCKKRGNNLEKRNRLLHQKASWFATPSRKLKEVDEAELNLASDSQQKKEFQVGNRFFAVDFENALTPVSYPVDVDGGMIKKSVKKKFGTDKTLMKGLFDPRDMSVLLENNRTSAPKKMNNTKTAWKGAEFTCKNANKIRNTQQNISDNNLRVAVNGNQGTKHTLLRCFMSKAKHHRHNAGKSSEETETDKSVSICMLSERGQHAQSLEGGKKLDNRGASCLCGHCFCERNYKLIFGNEKYDIKKSDYRSRLHLGNTKSLSNGKNCVQVLADQPIECTGFQKAEHDELHKESNAQFDCLTNLEMSNQLNQNKSPLRKVLKLKSGSIKHKQLEISSVQQGKGIKDKSRVILAASTELGNNLHGFDYESLYDKKIQRPAAELENDRNELCIDSSGERNKSPKNIQSDITCNQGSKRFQPDSTCNKGSNNLQPEFTFKDSGNARHAVSNVDTELDHCTSRVLESPRVTQSGSSHDEDEHRGRSKFERWASHSEQVADGICSRITVSNRIRLSTNIQITASRQRNNESDVHEAVNGNEKEAMATTTAHKRRKISKKLNVDDRLQNNESCNGSDGQVSVTWLREKLAKRKERFQRQITEATFPTQRADNMPKVIEVKAERPMRKRRWGGS